MINTLDPDFEYTPVSPHRPRLFYAPAEGGGDPEVSVVTPFFNESKLFYETAQSVLAQSLQTWEWIIVDDGSTRKSSRNLLDTYTSRDPRIRVLWVKKNSGPGAARNLSVGHARAPFVAFLDSDDLYEPTALEKWQWFLLTHPNHSFVKGFQVGFGAGGCLWEEGFHNGNRFLETNPAQTACMIPKEVFERQGVEGRGLYDKH